MEPKVDELGSINFEDITPETLPCIQQLLFERNGTLYSYTDWKYGESSPKGYRGVVALKGKDPVGCFGLMPKMLCSKEKQILCGWFADWYVTPSMRGSGLGTNLLKEITRKGNYPLFFGHPGPKLANELCLQNGWRAIPFQSSRRLIKSPHAYYERRTHYLVKRLLLIFQYYRKTMPSGSKKNVFRQDFSQDSSRIFNHQDVNWHCRQPVNQKISRNYGDWKGNTVSISYCDDILPSGEIRRRILLIENIHKYPQDIFCFFKETKKTSISHIEIFTTDKFTDSVLEKAGAIQFQESPILYYGNDSHPQDILMEGIDRENWLYLAGKQ